MVTGGDPRQLRCPGRRRQLPRARATRGGTVVVLALLVGWSCPRADRALATLAEKAASSPAPSTSRATATAAAPTRSCVAARFIAASRVSFDFFSGRLATTSVTSWQPRRRPSARWRTAAARAHRAVAGGEHPEEVGQTARDLVGLESSSPRIPASTRIETGPLLVVSSSRTCSTMCVAVDRVRPGPGSTDRLRQLGQVPRTPPTPGSRAAAPGMKGSVASTSATSAAVHLVPRLAERSGCRRTRRLRNVSPRGHPQAVVERPRAGTVEASAVRCRRRPTRSRLAASTNSATHSPGPVPEQVSKAPAGPHGPSSAQGTRSAAVRGPQSRTRTSRLSRPSLRSRYARRSSRCPARRPRPRRR